MHSIISLILRVIEWHVCSTIKTYISNKKAFCLSLFLENLRNSKDDAKGLQSGFCAICVGRYLYICIIRFSQDLQGKV